MSNHVCDSRNVEDRDEGSGNFHSIRRYWSCSQCSEIQSNQHITQWVDDNIAGVNKDNYDKF